MKEVVLSHPLITHKLSILRDKKTGTKEFREIITEIAVLLCYEATKDAKLKKTTIETPLEKYETYCLNEDDYAFVPILRAGMSMVEGIIKVIPNAKIGHIGLYRNEKTLEGKFDKFFDNATRFFSKTTNRELYTYRNVLEFVDDSYVLSVALSSLLRRKFVHAMAFAS